MKLNQAMFIIGVTILFISCKTRSNSSSQTSLREKISDFMQADFESEYNHNKTYLLAWSTSESNGTPVLKYAVWEVESLETIYKGTAIRGQVEWINNLSVLVYDYPGIIDDNSPLYKYKIDLITKKKTPLNDKDPY